MSNNLWCPVLDYKMIESNLDLFSVIDGFSKEYKSTKQKLFGAGCRTCGGESIKNEFSQFVRNKIVENKMIKILKQLDQNTIIRYGKKIYKAKNLI